MSVIDLSLFKQHARIDDYEGDSQDSVLQQCLDASESYTFRFLHRTYDELVEAGGGSLPAEVVQMILIYASYNYEEREGRGGQSVPTAFYTLGASWRKLTNDFNSDSE